MSASVLAQNSYNQPLKGDINEDGIVNIADISAIIQILNDVGTFSQYGTNGSLRGDVNEDGTIDDTDITTIIKIIKNVQEHFFYLGTIEPTAENYKVVPEVTTSYTSINDAIGKSVSVSTGQTLYLLCPTVWLTKKSVTIENDKGEVIDFLDEVDATTIIGYTIYKSPVWNDSSILTLKIKRPEIYVTNIILSETALTFGSKITSNKILTATVLPENADNKDLEWKSSNENVAAVTDRTLVNTLGKYQQYVVPIGFGNCTITCMAKDGSGVKAYCDVTVSQFITGITFNKALVSLRPGEEQKLIFTIEPSNATDKSLKWSSSNTNVAVVRLDGNSVIVSAVARGSCTITAEANDDGGVKATCEVTVSGGSINGHEFVEIAGLKWATMNVGATTIAGSYATSCGDYYAWGEFEPRYASMSRKSASEASFIWKGAYSDGYKDFNDILDSYRYDNVVFSDVARANWGGSWRIPTKSEFLALTEACSSNMLTGYNDWNIDGTLSDYNFDESKIKYGGIYWIESWSVWNETTRKYVRSDVSGILFVCASDPTRQVFFPATGDIKNTGLEYGGFSGQYWSCTKHKQYNDGAYILYFNKTLVGGGWDDASGLFTGNVVRPVSD